MNAQLNGQRKNIFGHWVTAAAVGDENSTWYYKGFWSRGDFAKQDFATPDEVFNYFEDCQYKGLRP